jgi:hypothetical protein
MRAAARAGREVASSHAASRIPVLIEVLNNSEHTPKDTRPFVIYFSGDKNIDYRIAAWLEATGERHIEVDIINQSSDNVLNVSFALSEYQKVAGGEYKGVFLAPLCNSFCVRTQG